MSTSRVAVVVFTLLCVPLLVVVAGVVGAVAVLVAVVAAVLVRAEMLRSRNPAVGTAAVEARPHPQTDRVTSRATPGSGDPVMAVSGVDPAECTDEELCWAWRCSFAHLIQASGPDAVDHLARLRGRYLDELERRNPQGFAAWMGSGARAASDPSPFFLSVR